jgi:HPt (histidine-containing phosphotransfer) domain-containing protein
MDDYLSKPVKPAQMLEMLQRYCGSVVSEQEPEAVVVPAPAPAVDDGIPVYAKADLLERLGGAEALIPRFMGLFFKGVEPNMVALEEAIAEGNPDKVRTSSHAIKGSSANIGAMQMRETAATIEADAKTGDITGAPAGLEILKRQLEEFKAATEN